MTSDDSKSGQSLPFSFGALPDLAIEPFMNLAESTVKLMGELGLDEGQRVKFLAHAMRTLYKRGGEDGIGAAARAVKILVAQSDQEDESVQGSGQIEGDGFIMGVKKQTFH